MDGKNEWLDTFYFKNEYYMYMILVYGSVLMHYIPMGRLTKESHETYYLVSHFNRLPLLNVFINS